MSCESFILLHEMQTKLMAFDKSEPDNGHRPKNRQSARC